MVKVLETIQFLRESSILQTGLPDTTQPDDKACDDVLTHAQFTVANPEVSIKRHVTSLYAEGEDLKKAVNVIAGTSLVQVKLKVCCSCVLGAMNRLLDSLSKFQDKFECFRARKEKIRILHGESKAAWVKYPSRVYQEAAGEANPQRTFEEDTKLVLKLLDEKPALVFVGQLKSGKSTLGNRLLQEHVFPSDEGPCIQQERSSCCIQRIGAVQVRLIQKTPPHFFAYSTPTAE